MGWRKRSLVLIVAAFLITASAGVHAAEAAHSTVVQTRNMLVVQDDGNTVIRTSQGDDVFRHHVVSSSDVFHRRHVFDRFHHIRHESLFFTADHLEDVIEHRCDLAEDRLDLQRSILEESVRGNDLREDIIDFAFDAKEDRLALQCDILLDRFG